MATSLHLLDHPVSNGQSNVWHAFSPAANHNLIFTVRSASYTKT